MLLRDVIFMKENSVDDLLNLSTGSHLKGMGIEIEELKTIEVTLTKSFIEIGELDRTIRTNSDQL